MLNPKFFLELVSPYVFVGFVEIGLFYFLITNNPTLYRNPKKYLFLIIKFLRKKSLDINITRAMIEIYFLSIPFDIVVIK